MISAHVDSDGAAGKMFPLQTDPGGGLSSVIRSALTSTGLGGAAGRSQEGVMLKAQDEASDK